MGIYENCSSYSVDNVCFRDNNYSLEEALNLLNRKHGRELLVLKLILHYFDYAVKEPSITLSLLSLD